MTGVDFCLILAARRRQRLVSAGPAARRSTHTAPLRRPRCEADETDAPGWMPGAKATRPRRSPSRRWRRDAGPGRRPWHAPGRSMAALAPSRHVDQARAIGTMSQGCRRWLTRPLMASRLRKAPGPDLCGSTSLQADVDANGEGPVPKALQRRASGMPLRGAAVNIGVQRYTAARRPTNNPRA